MKNHEYFARHGQSSFCQRLGILILGVMPLIWVGCQRAEESTLFEPAESAESAELANKSKPPKDDRPAPDKPGDKASASIKQAAPPVEKTTEPQPSPQSSTAQKPTVDISAFFDAALNGNLAAVEQAIEAGMNINATDEEQRSALMLASFNGHAPVAKMLLKKGATLGARDSNGRTALMFAATGANLETVGLLIANGAQIDAVDTAEKFTPLMFAAAEGQVEVVQVLLKHKADPNLRDIDGDTAQDFASRNGHAEVVRLLAK
jgi:hypothetical protein